MNIIEEIKAMLVLKKAASDYHAAPKLAFFDPAHIAMLLTIGATVYQGTLGIAPPQWSLYLGISLALIFMLYSLILKLHHQPTPQIPGIPPLDEAAILAFVEGKYPGLKKYDAAIKDAAAKVEAKSPEVPQ